MLNSRLIDIPARTLHAVVIAVLESNLVDLSSFHIRFFHHSRLKWVQIAQRLDLSLLGNHFLDLPSCGFAPNRESLRLFGVEI